MYSIGDLFMGSTSTTEKVIPYALLGMTAVTGLVDAVSFLSLGLGGRVMAPANADSQIRFAAEAFLLEVVFMFAASFCGIGYRAGRLEDSFQSLALIALTALAMGTRNAAVRKLAIQT